MRLERGRQSTGDTSADQIPKVPGLSTDSVGDFQTCIDSSAEYRQLPVSRANRTLEVTQIDNLKTTKSDHSRANIRS